MKSTVLVTQGGNDTYTSVVFPLPELDGKSGRQIIGMTAYWVDGAAVAAADYLVKALISTQAATCVPTDNEWLCAVMWGMQNTGGVAVAVGYEPQKSFMVTSERVTVQDIYAAVESTGTAQANDMYVTLEYELIKMTELEYLRMLAGGA